MPGREALRIELVQDQFGHITTAALDPELAEKLSEQESRLMGEQGAVVVLSETARDDGVPVIEVGLNSLARGSVTHCYATQYPAIVTALRAQGVTVPDGAILTLRSNWDEQ